MNVDETPNLPDDNANEKKYWLTLEQWKDDPAFREAAEREFMSSPFAEEEDAVDGSGQGGWARREFLKLMGASLALSSASCLRRPVQKIIPYVTNPEGHIPGVAQFYSSAWVDNGEVLGLVVRTREGRPIKIEGNPAHPGNRGGTSARAQAHILALYDPDRMQGPIQNVLNKEHTNRDTINTNWDALDQAVGGQIKKGNFAILSRSVASPTTRQLIADFTHAHGGEWVEWDPVGAEACRLGQKASYGADLVPNYKFDEARIVVSIDADFLGTYLTPVAATKAWSKVRKPGPEMARLIAFESMLSLTGENADDRIRIAPSQRLDVVLGLMAVMVEKNMIAVDGAVREVVAPFAGAAKRLGVDSALFLRVAFELARNKGRGIVIAGGIGSAAEDIRVQAAVNLLNSVLENDGSTIDYRSNLTSFRGSSKGLASLIEKMQSGKIKTVIIHDLNPVYQLPADSGFLEALRNVEMAVSTADRNDETALYCTYVAPDHNPLENWGDLESQSGVVSIQQPTIQPMYATRAFQDSLLAWSKAAGKTSGSLGAENWYTLLKNSWQNDIYKKGIAQNISGATFEDFWVNALQAGVVISSTSGKQGARRAAVDVLRGAKPSVSAGFELVLYSTVGLADGSLANVSWLHEFPDPVTKVVWDNYVCMAPATAESLNIDEGRIVQFKVGDKKFEAPVHIQPGLHDKTLAVAVGYGRSAAGKVANKVGFNGYDLMHFANAALTAARMPAEVGAKGKKYSLVSPQGHSSMEGRQIVVETTLADFLKNPSSGIHKHKIFSIWPKHEYKGHRWAMSIDLNACTGCGACTIACQSENNVTVVGKKYVMQGREMHWIRIDRYYEGSAENPDTVFQPMLCQHCENAPCETVCPVLATVHDDEGLNVMVYNRCVGTRYCSNNCPYKVRRFNWFNYVKKIEKPLEMALNPRVTVRPRGVMEKCTFCVQRIHDGKNKARDLGEPLRDGEIKTACEQSCPADAIVFGDVNNKESRVAKMFMDPRGYKVLEEVNAQPMIKYQSRVRNSLRQKAKKAGHSAGEHT